MSTPTSDSIALIWTEHAMGLHPIFFFFGFMSPEKPTTRVKQFLRETKTDRIGTAIFYVRVMKSKQNSNLDRQSKV